MRTRRWTSFVGHSPNAPSLRVLLRELLLHGGRVLELVEDPVVLARLRRRRSGVVALRRLVPGVVPAVGLVVVSTAVRRRVAPAVVAAAARVTACVLLAAAVVPGVAAPAVGASVVPRVGARLLLVFDPLERDGSVVRGVARDRIARVGVPGRQAQRFVVRGHRLLVASAQEEEV